MKITVVLCTYNRCKTLAKALESTASLKVADSIEWEVLVVDNNSKDQTRAVVEQFGVRYPGHFRYLFEPQAGKSHALNSGIRSARGDVLAFLDDDVIVEPTWLANLTAVFDEADCAGAGGRILPPLNFSPPRWLSSGEGHALAPLALFDPCANFGELTEPPFGTNMAFRRAMFEKYGTFRTDLGPQPGSEIRSEDTEFGRRLLNAGERLYYVPSAVVYHPVSENRLRQQYHLCWWFAKGRADVREFGVPAGAPRVAGIPIRLFLRGLVLTMRWTLAVEPSRRFGFKRTLWCHLGMVKECFQLRHQASASPK